MQLVINGREALVNEHATLTVAVPGLVVGRHDIRINIVDEDGFAHEKVEEGKPCSASTSERGAAARTQGASGSRMDGSG